MVLYQMLTGRVPFDGPTDFLILKAQLEDLAAPPSSQAPDVPGWLDRLVLKALAKAPADRFQTVEELRLFLAGGGSLPLPGDEDRELPTLVLPPRTTPALSSSLPASPETIETDRPRLPVGPATRVPPPTPGTSYRPVRETVGRRRILFAVATAALLAVVVTAFFLGTSHVGPVSDSAPRVQPAAAPVPATAGPASQPAAATTPAVIVSPPPLPARAPKKRENPRPESPQPASPEPSTASPAPEKSAPAPAEPAPAGEEMAAKDLPRLTGELAERSEKLGELYKDFLDKKEDGGAELTEADNQLKDEIDALAAAADRFNKRINERFFVRAWDRLKRQDQPEAIRRRAQDLASSAGRIDRLMAQVQPSADVRQEWQEVRHRWARVAQIVASR